MSPGPTYVPGRGDIVWLEYNPQAGRKQAGHRPALVISPMAYNQKVGLALFCPITSHAKSYPFEVPLPSSLAVNGVVLSDHIKSLDWNARKAVYKARAPRAVIEQVLQRVLTLLREE